MRTRLHLEAAALSEQAWRDEWATTREWCAASGSTGENDGNRVFKLDPHGRLRITVPLPVAARFGLPKPHARAAGGVLTLAAPVRFAHHGAELAARVTNRLGVRFDLEPVYAGGRVVKLYLRACWTREDVPPVPSLEAARAGGVVAVDLNADHLAAARLDSSGNPVGAPVVIPLVQEGPASLRDARLRTAITALLDFTRASGAGTLVVEDLNFTDPAIRERTGRGRRAKTFRRTVAGILTGALRTRPARPGTPPEGWKPPHVMWGWCGQPDQARQARVHVGAPPGHADRTCPPPRGRGCAPAATGAPGREYAYLPAVTTPVTRRHQE
jgi:hypothetical protein